MDGVICLRCKNSPCTCVDEASAQLDTVVEQFASLPQEARQILETVSPAGMALALLEARDERESLIVERDHFKGETLKLGRILYAAAVIGGETELRVPLDLFSRDGRVVLDYEIVGDEVVVTYEDDREEDTVAG